MNSIGLRCRYLVLSVVTRMSSTNSSYEDAIRKLNSLQSNKATIDQIKRNIKTGQKCTNIEDMENYLQRIGIPLSKLDELSVIHVAGTKGKGSTSAMCESILRHHGFRTGFYSSPHLVAARERIRLDGRPLSEHAFAQHLHQIYDVLHNTQEFEGNMPKYFAFLTVLAFHVFLREKVDVAIVEVGIGGIVDYTNVLRKVPVVGITALGLDHTAILGNTLPQIAAAKAGVMKRGCDAYTVRQPADAMDVLTAVADRVKCPLTVAPDFTSYTFPESKKSPLRINLDAYKMNASLAIQLSHAWMRQATTKRNSCVSLSNEGQNGFISLENDLNGHENGINDTSILKSHGNALNGRENNLNGHGNVLNSHVNGYNNHENNLNGRDSKLTNHKNGFNNHENDRDSHENELTNHKNSLNGHINDKVNVLGNQNFLNVHVNGSKFCESGLNANTSRKLVYEISNETAEGLRCFKWPGRYQVVQGGYATFYLDGAHTKESVEICANWFQDSSSRSQAKALIFSATGDRNAEILLQPLFSIPFSHVYFVIPTAHKSTSQNSDNYSLVEQEELIQRCRNHARIWRSVKETEVTVLECVSDALVSVKKDGCSPSVLITGSLHLVGAALSILDPNLSS